MADIQAALPASFMQVASAQLNAAKGRALKKVLTLGEEVSTFINKGISLRKIVEHYKIITIKKIFLLVILFTCFFLVE